MAGRPNGSKNKPKGEEKALDKYIMGGEETLTNGVAKICSEIEALRRKMKGEMEKLKEQMAEERLEREEQRRREREEWLEEKRRLVERIETLEWINEKKKREKRRNKIMVKGIKCKKERLEQEVTKFIEDNIRVKVEIKKASIITTRENKEMVIAEVDSWEQKRNIMSRKKNLERGIIIEDDLTQKEREIQQQLREIASRERKKGAKNVRIGYKKIKMEEKWMRWNEKEGRLEEERRKE